MRKILTVLLSIMAATACSAITTITNNVIGVMRVDSSERQTVVAIPWIATGVVDADIRVKDVVNTASLSEGDQLLAYINQNWKCWTLEGGKWEASQIVTSTSCLPAAGVPAADQAIRRGEAIILVRQKPSSCFYVNGQVSTNRADVAETLPANAASLIAPPSTTATNLNDGDSVEWNFGEGDHSSDQIIYKDAEANAIRYAKLVDNKTWRSYNTVKRSWSDDVVIPAGQGAWYKNETAESVIVIWKNGNHL